jgi:hypothetical protein
MFVIAKTGYSFNSGMLDVCDSEEMDILNSNMLVFAILVARRETFLYLKFYFYQWVCPV